MSIYNNRKLDNVTTNFFVNDYVCAYSSRFVDSLEDDANNGIHTVDL